MTDTDTTPAETGTHRITLYDRWRLFWYLDLVYDLMSGSDLRAWRDVRRELMANTKEAATHVGMRQAIADLGPARDLARRYSDAMDLRRRPQWRIACAATVAVMVLFVAASMLFGAGFYSAADQLAPVQQISADFLGITFWRGPDFLGALLDWRYMLVWLACLGVIFLAVGRFWRVIPALRPPSAG